MTNLMKAIETVNGTVETRAEVLVALANELGLVVAKDWVVAGSTDVITNKARTIKLIVSCTKKDGKQVIKRIIVGKVENKVLEGCFFYNLKRGKYEVTGSEEFEVSEKVETVEVEPVVEEVAVEEVETVAVAEVETVAVAVETVNVVITDRKTGIRIDYYTITTDKLEAELEDLKRQSNYYKDCNVTVNGKLELRF